MRTIFFVAGGTLTSGSPSYVERAADHELLAALTSNDYCYVLDSRQKGKSSLISRADERIRAFGIDTVRLDLQRYGSNVTAEQWFAGMLNDVGEDLGLTPELFEYWKTHLAFGPVKRFFGALADVVLPLRDRPIVIFIDEVDFVLSLPFSADEFFAAIRESYNRRAVDREFRRLTFCLAGVATPSSLVQSVQITPFNIGRRIELTDFATTELTPYERALGPTGPAIIRRVHYWTGGHPYLTQRLCAELASGGFRSARAVDGVVAKLFFSEESRREEPNLADVGRRLLETRVADFRPDESRTRLLDLYREMRSGTRKVPDDETDPFAEVLKLSGLTRTVDGRLRVRNRIYARVFDDAWIASNLPDAERRRQSAAFKRGVFRATAGILGGLALVVLPLAIALNALSVSAANLRLAHMRASFTGDVLHAQRMLEIQSLWNRNGRGISAIRALLHGDLPAYQSAFEVQYYRRIVHMQRFTIPCPGDGRFTAVGATPHEVVAGTSDGTIMALSPRGALGPTAKVDGAIDLITPGVAGREFLIADTAGGLYHWAPGPDNAAELLPRSNVRWKALAIDGNKLLAVGADGTLRMEVGAGAPNIGHLPAKRVRCAAISTTAGLVAFAESPSVVEIYSLKSKAITGRFPLPAGEAAASVAFSNDGRRLAIGEYQLFARLIDTSKGTLQWVASTHNSGGTVGFSPDGKRVLVAGSDNSVEVLQANNGAVSFTDKGHDAAIVQATYASGDLIVSVARDELMGWEGQYGVDTHIMTPPRLQDLKAISLSPTFRLIVTGHANGDLCLWRPFRTALVASHPGTGAPVTALAVSPDGSQVAAGFADGAVLVGNFADLSGFHSPGQADGAVLSLAFSPDAQSLAAGTSSGEVARFDLGAKVSGPAAQSAVTRSFGGPVIGLSYRPQDGRSLAVASDRLWMVDAETLRPSDGWDQDAMVNPTCVAFSPNGKRVAAADAATDLLRLFDVSTGKPTEEFHGFDQRVGACAFSPDGQRLAATDDSGVMVLLGVGVPGEIVPELELTYPERTAYSTLVFKPDGEALFGGSLKSWSQYWFGDYAAPDEPYP